MRILKPEEESQISLISSLETKEGILFKLYIAIQDLNNDDEDNDNYLIQIFQSESEEYGECKNIASSTYFVEDQRTSNLNHLLDPKIVSYPMKTIKKAYPNLKLFLKQSLNDHLIKDKDWEDVFYFQALLPKNDAIIKSVLSEIKTMVRDNTFFNKNNRHYPELHLLKLLKVLSIKAIKPL